MKSLTSERQTLVAACLAVIQAVVSHCRLEFGTGHLPERSATFVVMVPGSPGSYTGKRFEFRETDWMAVWRALSPDITNSQAWNEACTAIDRFIEVNKIEAVGFSAPQASSHYLWPLIESYLGKVGRFAFRTRLAQARISALLLHLESREVTVAGLGVLQGFRAPRPFRLDGGIIVRPISDEEIALVGRTGPGEGFSVYQPELTQPRSDWWVCDVSVKNARGTVDGWNSVNPMIERLALALRAFKSGGFGVGLARLNVKGPFGGAGTLTGTRFRYLFPGEDYELTAAEIHRFVGFWRSFSGLMSKPRHYLQLPVRRLATAGIRPDPMDAIVDYVVGLEALLGKPDERTELSFRFKVRGAVLLAPGTSTRRRLMRDLDQLYSLRSRIVHGQAIKDDDLRTALPLAEEALRRVWSWYFRLFRDKSNNVAGVDQIDAEVFGPR